MLKRIICFFFGHDREYWSKEKVAKEGAMGGVFTPYACKCCDFKAPAFPYPSQNPPTVDNGVLHHGNL